MANSFGSNTLIEAEHSMSENPPMIRKGRLTKLAAM